MAEKLATNAEAIEIGYPDVGKIEDTQLCTIKRAQEYGCIVDDSVGLIETRIVKLSHLSKEDVKYEGIVHIVYRVSNSSYTPGMVVCKTNMFSPINCYAKAIGGYSLSNQTCAVECIIGVNKGMTVYIFVSDNTTDYSASNFHFATELTFINLDIQWYDISGNTGGK